MWGWNLERIYMYHKYDDLEQMELLWRLVSVPIEIYENINYAVKVWSVIKVVICFSIL